MTFEVLCAYGTKSAFDLNSQQFSGFIYRKIIEVCLILMSRFPYLRLLSHLTYMDIGIKPHMHLIRLDYIVFSLPASSLFQTSMNW